MKSILTILLLSLPFYSFSKANSFSVKGNLITVDSKEIPFANILLIAAEDSSLVKGSVSNEKGIFNIDDIATGKYRLLFSMVGFKKTYTEEFTLDDEHNNIDFRDFILESVTETLDEFAVVAQKPFIERHLDKLVVNVENSIVAAGNTALEVLKRSPGVIVDKDGNISLKGKSGVIIMIDGKQTYLSSEDLSNMLKNMPADQIEKIEIITNPSAKYDAAGNAGIINIILKKNQMLGVNGSVRAGYNQARYSGYNGGGNINYRTEKWNFFLSINHNDRNGFNNFDMTRRFRVADTIVSVFNQEQSQKDQSQTNSGKFAIDFFPNKKHTLGFFVNGMMNNSKEQGSNESLINDPYEQLLSGSATNSDNSGKWNNLTGNINYNWKIDTSGKDLSVNLDYAQFNSRSKQLYHTSYFDQNFNYFGNPYILKSDLPSTVTIYSGKIDYVHPIGKKIRIDAGVKSSYVHSDNNAQFWFSTGNDFAVDSGKTNHFKFTENINAAYLNYLMEINDKFSFQLGLRAEQTYNKGEQITSDSTFTRNYTNLFPSGFLTYKMNKNNEFGLSYSRRIDRPDYESLNPFIYFLDPYSYMKGNTLLLPQYSNSYELSHTFMGFLSTSVNFTRTHGVITQVTSQDDATLTTYATNENLDINDVFSVSTMLPIPISKWFTSVNFITVYNSRYKGQISGGEFDKNATAFMLNSQNMFNFKKGWSAEITAFYMSKQVYGIFLMYPMSNISLGVQKTFAKDRATIKCSFTDMFWMNRFRGAVQYQNMDLYIDTRNMSRMFGVNFSWKFGNSKAQMTRKESGASDEIDRLKGGK